VFGELSKKLACSRFTQTCLTHAVRLLITRDERFKVSGQHCNQQFSVADFCLRLPNPSFVLCGRNAPREHEAEIARHRFAERRTDSGRALLLKATQSRPDRTPVRHD